LKIAQTACFAILKIAQAAFFLIFLLPCRRLLVTLQPQILFCMPNQIFRCKIYQKLLDWKNESNGESALLIEGARRRALLLKFGDSMHYCRKKIGDSIHISLKKFGDFDKTLYLCSRND